MSYKTMFYILLMLIFQIVIKNKFSCNMHLYDIYVAKNINKLHFFTKY